MQSLSTSPTSIEKWIIENFKDLETIHETDLSTTYEGRDRLSSDQMLVQVTKLPRNTTFELFKSSISSSLKLLGHPHILAADKVYTEDKSRSISYCVKFGRTLVDVLNIGSPLTITRAVNLLKTLTGALTYAREKLNVSHNNIKPSNIIFINGIEHVAGWERTLPPADQLKKLTKETLAYNSLSYLAPEVAKDYSMKNIDLHKSDVYSLGLIFLFARGITESQIKSLKSRAMMSSNSAKENLIAESVLQKTGETFEHSKAVRQILSQMLHKSPQERLSLDVLKQKLDQIPVKTERPEHVEELEIEQKVNSLLQAAQNEFNSKNYTQALNLYEECLTSYQDSKATCEQPLYAHCLIGIGNVLNSQGRLREATEHYSEAQEIFRKRLGDTHPDVATCLFNKATVFVKQNSYVEAVRYFEKSMMLYSVTFGLNSSKVADCLIGVGDVYYNQGKEEDALIRYYEALDMKKRKCNDFHPDIAECFSKIADILKKQGRYVQAIASHEESLRIFRNYYGENHHQVAVTLNNLGVILKKMGRMQESMQKYTESMTVYRNCYGKWHPKVADCLYNMAINLKSQKDVEGALQKYDESLEIYRHCYNDFHPEVVIVLEAIDSLMRSRVKRYHTKV